jgi:addiction module RelE/StbE family toxin
MKRSVRILRKAQSDLEGISDYVRRDRPEAADRLIRRLVDNIESLETLPNRGTVPHDPRLSILRLRVLVVGDYLVFYKVLRSQVRVYRVLHGHRKYEHLI